MHINYGINPAQFPSERTVLLALSAPQVNFTYSYITFLIHFLLSISNL